MDPADNSLCTNTFGHARPPLINQSHDVTALGTRLAHNGHLSTCHRHEDKNKA